MYWFMMARCGCCCLLLLLPPRGGAGLVSYSRFQPPPTVAAAAAACWGEVRGVEVWIDPSDVNISRCTTPRPNSIDLRRRVGSMGIIVIIHTNTRLCLLLLGSARRGGTSEQQATFEDAPEATFLPSFHAPASRLLPPALLPWPGLTSLPSRDWPRSPWLYQTSVAWPRPNRCLRNARRRATASRTLPSLARDAFFHVHR